MKGALALLLPIPRAARGRPGTSQGRHHLGDGDPPSGHLFPPTKPPPAPVLEAESAGPGSAIVQGTRCSVPAPCHPSCRAEGRTLSPKRRTCLKALRDGHCQDDVPDTALACIALLTAAEIAGKRLKILPTPLSSLVPGCSHFATSFCILLILFSLLTVIRTENISVGSCSWRPAGAPPFPPRCQGCWVCAEQGQDTGSPRTQEGGRVHFGFKSSVFLPREWLGPAGSDALDG